MTYINIDSCSTLKENLLNSVGVQSTLIKKHPVYTQRAAVNML